MRRRPISRDEVRIIDFHVCTMPADSVRIDEDGCYSETIERLWKPLIAQLTKEQADYEAGPMRAMMEDWYRRGISGPPSDYPTREPPSIPRIARGTWAWASNCSHCEREFFNIAGRYSRYCCDACVHAAQAPRRAARIAAIVKARSEARAKARADRKCAACGEPIAAERATKWFCSTACRMRAHRQGEGADTRNGRGAGLQVRRL